LNREGREGHEELQEIIAAEVFSYIMHIVLLINQKDYELILSLMGKAEVFLG